MVQRVGVVTVLSALVLGCGTQRVVLRPVPEKTAPLRERQRAFRDLAPESGLQTTYYQNGIPVGTNINWLILGDGTRVVDPRDLIPAVGARSRTATYASSFEKKWTTGSTVGAVGLTGVVAGVVIMLVPLVLPSSLDGSFFDRWVPWLLAGGGVELAGIITWMVGIFLQGSASADRISAFQAYPRDLARHLALEDESGPEEKPKGRGAPEEVDAHTDVPFRLALFPGQ